MEHQIGLSRSLGCLHVILDPFTVAHCQLVNDKMKQLIKQPKLPVKSRTPQHAHLNKLGVLSVF